MADDNPPAAPWWHSLIPGQRVTVTRDAAPVMLADGRQALVNGRPITRSTGNVLDVARTPTDGDILRAVVQVFPDRPPFPGGLFVHAADIRL